MLKYICISFISALSLIVSTTVSYSYPCDREWEMYPLTKEYKLRIEDKIPKYGCKIIKLYDILAKNKNIYLMDVVDENPKVLKYLIKVSKYKHIIKSFSKIQDEISLRDSVLSENFQKVGFWERFYYILKHSLSARRNANPEYLIYPIIAAEITDSNSQALELYGKILSIPLVLLKNEALSVNNISLLKRFIDRVLLMKTCLSKDALIHYLSYKYI